MNLITLENISKSYSEKILVDNISLGINEGEKIGIIGVNGTGKSTFLKIILVILFLIFLILSHHFLNLKLLSIYVFLQVLFDI